MKKLNVLSMMLVSVILTILTTGCVSLTDEEAIRSYKYYENGGDLKELTFGKYAYSIGKVIKQYDVAGYSRIYGEREFNIFKYREKNFGLINVDNNSAVKHINKNTFRSLGDAKSMKLYEFGTGLIESAIYTSTSGLCKNFASKKGIRVDFTTNYYPNPADEPNDFFATIAKARLKETARSQVLNSKIIIHTQDAQKKAFIEEQAAKNLDTLLQSDANKLGSFIMHLCKSR